MTAVRTRELALGVLGFLDTPAPEFVRTAAAAGFDSVSLRVGGSRTSVAADLSQHPELLAPTEAALASTGIRVLDVEVLRLYPDETGSPSLAERAEAVLGLAARLGARNVIVVNQGLDPDECVRALRLVCDLASVTAPGVLVCLEFMAFSATRDLVAAADIVRRADRSAAAVLVDALHLARTHGGSADLVAATDVLAPYVQVCGIPSGDPGRDALVAEATTARRLPGRGTGEEMVVLRAVASDCAVSLEAPRRSDRRRSPERRAHAGMKALRASLEALS
jgi:sugar phosphate isomerase/epimerase